MMALPNCVTEAREAYRVLKAEHRERRKTDDPMPREEFFDRDRVIRRQFEAAVAKKFKATDEDGVSPQRLALLWALAKELADLKGGGFGGKLERYHAFRRLSGLLREEKCT
jgi:hypothetical protein